MRRLLLLAPFVLSACSSFGPGDFYVEADPPALVLANGTDGVVD